MPQDVNPPTIRSASATAILPDETRSAGEREKSAPAQAVGKVFSESRNEGLLLKAVAPVSKIASKVSSKTTALDTAVATQHGERSKGRVKDLASRFESKCDNATHGASGKQQPATAQLSSRTVSKAVNEASPAKTVQPAALTQTGAVERTYDFNDKDVKKFAEVLVARTFNKLCNVVRQGDKKAVLLNEVRKLIDPKNPEPDAVAFRKHCETHLRQSKSSYAEVVQLTLKQLDAVLEFTKNKPPLISLNELSNAANEKKPWDLKDIKFKSKSYTLKNAKDDISSSINGLRDHADGVVERGEKIMGHCTNSKQVKKILGEFSSGFELSCSEVAGQCSFDFDMNQVLSKKEFKKFVDNAAVRLFAEYLIDPAYVLGPDQPNRDERMPGHRGALLNTNSVLTHSEVRLQLSETEGTFLHIQRFWGRMPEKFVEKDLSFLPLKPAEIEPIVSTEPPEHAFAGLIASAGLKES